MKISTKPLNSQTKNPKKQSTILQNNFLPPISFKNQYNILNNNNNQNVDL